MQLAVKVQATRGIIEVIGAPEDIDSVSHGGIEFDYLPTPVEGWDGLYVVTMEDGTQHTYLFLIMAA